MCCSLALQCPAQLQAAEAVVECGQGSMCALALSHGHEIQVMGQSEVCLLWRAVIPTWAPAGFCFH